MREAEKFLRVEGWERAKKIEFYTMSIIQRRPSQLITPENRVRGLNEGPERNKKKCNKNRSKNVAVGRLEDEAYQGRKQLFSPIWTAFGCFGPNGDLSA